MIVVIILLFKKFKSTNILVTYRCYILSFVGTFINSNKPVAVFSGNERTGIPYQQYVGWDHAADQLPKIATAADLNPSLGTAYRYDVMPTAENQLYDTYQ